MRSFVRLTILFAALAVALGGCKGGTGSPSGARGGTTGGATTGGSGVFFQENFDGPAPPKFNVALFGSTPWSIGSPTFGPGAAHSAPNCAAVTLSASYTAGISAVAATDAFSLAGATKPILVLFGAYDIDTFAPDGARVKVLPQGGLITSIDPFRGYSRFHIPVLLDDAGFTGNSNRAGPKPVYLEERFDLTPFIGETIQIVFDFEASGVSSGGAGWFVDDIEVAEETVVGLQSSPFVTAPVLFDNFDGLNSLFQPGNAVSPDWEVQRSPPTGIGIGPGVAFSGTKCAGTCLDFVDPAASGGRYRDGFGSQPAQPPDRLVSINAVQLGNANEALLVFEHFFDLEPPANDGARVVAAKDRSIGPWIPLAPRDGYGGQSAAFRAFPPTDCFVGQMDPTTGVKNGWHRCSVDLGPAIQQLGPIFFIGFELASDARNAGAFGGWYLDDVEILTR